MKDLHHKPGLSVVPPANEMSWNCLDPDGFSRSKEGTCGVKMILFTMAIAETPDKQVIGYLAVPQRPRRGLIAGKNSPEGYLRAEVR